MEWGARSVDQLEIVIDAIRGGFGAILGVAGTVVALTALMFLLGSVRAMRRPGGYRRRKERPHGDRDGHGHSDHGPDLEFELGAIAEKLDRIAAAVEPKGWGLLRRTASNVFWSVFGVVAGIVIQALWAP